MKSLLDYSDEELKLWISTTRKMREEKRLAGLESHFKVKKEKQDKVEKKAKAQGIEVIEMNDILKGFLSSSPNINEKGKP